MITPFTATPADSHHKQDHPPQADGTSLQDHDSDHGLSTLRKLIARMKHQEAAMTCADIDTIETWWISTQMTRRCALVMLIRPFAALCEDVKNDRDFALPVAETYHAIDFGQYEELLNRLKGATAWMMAALAARKDMQEVLDEARASVNQDGAP
ncbi:MAG: hypothetical protein EPN23_11065 [Verrucomicrobia bacterium]|nr:MAG: hypothetical protein EPN23_11065 [Verrucomicrobiota bacterium]